MPTLSHSLRNTLNHGQEVPVFGIVQYLCQRPRQLIFVSRLILQAQALKRGVMLAGNGGLTHDGLLGDQCANRFDRLFGL